MRRIYLLAPICVMLGLVACKKNEPKEDPSYDKDFVEGTTFTDQVTIDFGNNAKPVITCTLPDTSYTCTLEGNDVIFNAHTQSNVEYILTGTTSNGSFKLYSEKKFKLELQGCDITSKNKPAINLQSSKRVFVVLTPGTKNRIKDSGEYFSDKEENMDNEDRKGAFFAEGQVVVSGSGSLEITSSVKHAMASDEYIRIREGNLTLTSTLADGLHTKDSLLVEDGTLTIQAEKDGIQITRGGARFLGGTVSITSNDDCLRATYGDEDTDTDDTIVTDITIEGANLTLQSKKLSEKAYGIYTHQNIYLNEGSLAITLYTKANALSCQKATQVEGFTYTYQKAN